VLFRDWLGEWWATTTNRQGHGRAVDAGMLAQSPCRRVPLPKVEREGMRFLTPAEVARAGHSSVSFTLDRYGHLYPEADTALRDRLDALYGSARSTPASSVMRLPRRPGRGPSVAPCHRK
jgi:hypothetical protein